VPDSNNRCGCCLLYLSQNICWFDVYFGIQSLHYHTFSWKGNGKSVGSIHVGYLGVCMTARVTATTPLGEMLPSLPCDDHTKRLVPLY